MGALSIQLEKLPSLSSLQMTATAVRPLQSIAVLSAITPTASQ